MSAKLALGTAQFGMAYGINNKRGQVPAAEVRTLLKIAAEAGVDTIDTAYAYGESEKILGTSLANYEGFRIVTKYPAAAEDSRPYDYWQASSERLGHRPIYGYLLHNYNSFRHRLDVIDFLQELRMQGRVQRTGFSLYDPGELEEILQLGLPFEMVQVPFSLLDQRFLPYFKELRAGGIEIHTRSCFLQGLVFKSPEHLSGFFAPVREILCRLGRSAAEMGVSIADLCLGYCLGQQDIDRVVVGVDGIDNLNNNLASQSKVEAVGALLSNPADYRLDSSSIVNPSLWETI